MSCRRMALWAALLSVLPSLALAQCTTKADSSALTKSVKLAAKCNQRRLQSGPAVTCKTAVPPACAGTLATDAIALAWGANNPAPAAIDRRALKDQFNCQKVISKGVVNFVSKKLRYLINGLSAAEAETKARHSIDKIPDKCVVTVAQDVSLVILPDVGPQLDAAVPRPPAAPSQPTALRDALVTLLETWVDRVGPNAAPLRPNIVFILTDDQRFDTIGLEHSKDDGVTPVMPTVLNEIVEQGRQVPEQLRHHRALRAEPLEPAVGASTPTPPACTTTAAPTAASARSTTPRRSPCG